MVFLRCGVLPNISPEELAFWVLFSLILGVDLINGKEQKGHLGVWEWPCSSVEAWLPSVMAPLCTRKALRVTDLCAVESLSPLGRGHEMREPRGLSHSSCFSALLSSRFLPCSLFYQDYFCIEGKGDGPAGWPPAALPRQIRGHVYFLLSWSETCSNDQWFRLHVSLQQFKHTL